MTQSHSESGQHKAHGGFGKALLVGAGLLILTTTSYLLSRLNLSPALGLVVALSIAVVKGTLIAFFYMHLSERAGGPRLVVAISLAFVAILVGLILVEASDRLESTMPPGPFPTETLPGLSGELKAAPNREYPSEQTP